MFFPLYYKEAVSSEKDKSLSVTFPGDAHDKKSRLGLDISSKYFNVTPTIRLCPKGHICLSEYCQLHKATCTQVQ
jgi:hypothetical protein